ASDEALRPMGRATSGVLGMRFNSGDELLTLGVVREGTFVLVATDGGYAKRTPIEDYSVQGRGGKGVVTIQHDSKRGRLVGALIVEAEDELYAITSAGGVIRTLQQKIVSLQQEDEAATGDFEAKIKVFAECTITELLKDSSDGTDRIAGAFGYWRESGRFVQFDAPAVVLATGGIGKSFKVTSNSWEYTGDGHALALRAGATLINMEFIQFHPTGMVWPPSVKGILVTEGVRGDGGVLRNSDGKRFMFDYIPEVFKDKYADNEEEADRWYTDPDGNRRTPDLLPRDEVARAINSEVKAG
ncbi:FAD-binding protein, partial [Kibdelosporangium lantanae]